LNIILNEIIPEMPIINHKIDDSRKNEIKEIKDKTNDKQETINE
tara:strand:- start:173 stop:304 length:132 start_codon:yes stop_codon:yes gene_type:complete